MVFFLVFLMTLFFEPGHFFAGFYLHVFTSIFFVQFLINALGCRVTIRSDKKKYG